MILKQIIDKIDIQQCISDLVTLHRKHYYEPGYIISSEKISKKYNTVFNLITSYSHTTQQRTIDFKYNRDKYELYVDGMLLRDWFIENSQPYNILYYMKLNYPKNLTLSAVLLEIIFEITYYSFPETVENLV